MKGNGRIPRGFHVYLLVLFAVAATASVVSWRAWPAVLDGRLVLLFIVVVAAEALSVRLPTGATTSLSFPVMVAALILLGPTSGAIVVSGSSLSVEDFRSRRHPALVAGNLCQLVLTALAAGWLHFVLGGRALAEGPLRSEDLSSFVLPMVALAATSLAVNVLLVAVGVSFYRGIPLRRVWSSMFSWSLAPQFALAFLGVALAQVVALLGEWGLLLFVFPLIVARQLYQRFINLKDAYLDTVSSLVAAIEAKDPYTRGHSERVAETAASIGRSMGLPDARVQRIVFASLLHDVGKIGIPRRILGKEGGLTVSELDEIRKHPSIGAHILARVPYLSEVVPAVLSHHERFDGGGYGKGLRGGAVPLEARILAVADSFDAMITRRPYREALSQERAVAEIRADAGRQFDPTVVEYFLAALGLPSRVAEDAEQAAVGAVVVEDA